MASTMQTGSGALSAQNRVRLLYLAGALPAIWTFYLGLADQLGADPVKALEHELGIWALRFLIAGLAITPLRQIGGPNLVRYRRAIGLLAFFYALLHLLTWLALDRGLDAGEIVKDIVKRPYITVGMLAFAILVPLAATSNATTIKRLGAAAWRRLHRWVYVAAIAAALHYLLLVKRWTAEPLIYAGLVAALLLFRVAWRLRPRPDSAAAKTARANVAERGGALAVGDAKSP